MNVDDSKTVSLDQDLALVAAVWLLFDTETHAGHVHLAAAAHLRTHGVGRTDLPVQGDNRFAHLLHGRIRAGEARIGCIDPASQRSIRSGPRSGLRLHCRIRLAQPDLDLSGTTGLRQVCIGEHALDRDGARVHVNATRAPTRDPCPLRRHLRTDSRDHLPLRRHLPIDDADVLRVGADLTHQRAVTGHAGTHVLPVGSRRQLVSRRRVGPAVGSAIPHHGPALAVGGVGTPQQA
ncbi:hypothetical protein G6F50_014111 [Rhizopus delemar]|uniref:Uncharacterized protein n=1 Tax=Rhizopus delemar TaxID=936053 RepID=A0A9P7C9A1_9FUNG|nr:hypothetical protein G6F50_014111 [Rhizopus delemar]